MILKSISKYASHLDQYKIISSNVAKMMSPNKCLDLDIFPQTKPKLAQTLPQVSPNFARSQPKLCPNFAQSQPEVCPNFA